MAQKVDLYTLLKTFSQKSYAPVIETEVFIKFMEKNTQRNDAAALNIDDWRVDTRGKILRGINELVTQNKINLEGSGRDQKIVLNSFFSDIISRYYHSIDINLGKPFPDEKMLKLKLPEAHLKTFAVESEMVDYLNEKHENPSQIIKMIFPNNYGTGLALEAQFPKKIMEISLLKIENGLRTRRQMEYIYQKVLSHFHGQEIRVRNFFNVLRTYPIEIVKEIEESSEFIYSILLFICPLIRKNIEELIMRSNTCSADQVALIQSVALIMSFNNYYQVLAINRRNSDTALLAVYEAMSDPPYMYMVSDILQFKNSLGVLLNQRYTQPQLDVFLKEKMSFGEDGKLPQILKFKARDGGEWLVKKEYIWPMSIKMLAEVQPQVKNEINQRWMKMLREYKHESAMEKENDFDDLIFRFCNFFSPMLLTIIQDKKVALLQEEILNERGALSKDEKLFDVDRPLPLKTLLGLRKEDIIHNCKLALPFWYSINFVTKFIRFVKYGGKKKPQGQVEAQGKTGGNNAKPSESFHETGVKLASVLVPEGETIDENLETVRDRWNQKLDITAQKNLTEDVNMLVKAHLNQVLKIQKPNSFDKQMLEENAERIIKMNATLDKINNKNALKMYIKLYITKLLLAKK